MRKKAEGFNYTAAVPAYNPAEEERRHPRQQQRGQRPPRRDIASAKFLFPAAATRRVAGHRKVAAAAVVHNRATAVVRHGPISGNREGANLRTTTGRPQSYWPTFQSTVTYNFKNQTDPLERARLRVVLATVVINVLAVALLTFAPWSDWKTGLGAEPV